ncbi:MAG TPA: 4-hydroxythreonine-4-phosphate dehydrogenase PdxA [bacterium]|nr:4-hydroxythreonine-4-phosphate dehydrogenase PdxA [bacterium]
MTKYQPIIAITMGDPSGIGAEIIAKTFSHREIYDRCRPLVVGDASVIDKGVEIAGVQLSINPVQKIADANFRHSQIDVFDLQNVDAKNLELGTISAGSGRAAFEAIKRAIELALARDVDATVTCPIHKEAINRAGYKFAGHTEIYAHFTNTKDFTMLLVHDKIRVAHVSTHVSLRQAVDLVKKERILAVIGLLHEACVDFGIQSPLIGVAGLNPHASDGGLFGDEEAEEIIPAIEQALKKGYQLKGPFPPDILFPMAKQGYFDGCVAMYHDQGHIPLKLLGFDWDSEQGAMKHVRGVNITLGLPIVRVSVDHGTAFDIAGKGVASPDSLLSAINFATLLAAKQG